MTKWVENPTGGRDRGPVALVRAWVETILRPRRLYRTAVAPADQAPGLVFAATVVLVEEVTRVLAGSASYPVFGGRPAASVVFWLAIATTLVAPAALHLTAALQTALLIPFVEDRAGISETVQVIAYATAPCALAGLPSPEVRALATVYGAVLLAVGIAEVHHAPLSVAAALTALPSAFVFGYGFRGFAAFSTVTGLTWADVAALADSLPAFAG
ncbi:MAG: YIP1 family protein [Haloarculaceae archaeon]